jgi:oligogalacturonide lyase
VNEDREVKPLRKGTIMASREKSGSDRATAQGNQVDRRHFLTDLAAAGGAAAVSVAAANPLVAAEPEQEQEPKPATGTSAPAASGGRGTVQDVRGEIKESKDPKTGGRVRRLTGDGSSNIHPYFTSWAFVGNDADNTVFISNRTGRYQWHLLNISAGRLVQLTAGENLKPNMACLARGGRLFYFDDQILRSVDTNTLKDRELYRVPAGFKPALPTCTADGRYVAFAYIEETALSTETGRIYSNMHERFYQHPQSVIMRIGTETGDAVAVWGETTWISHVLIHPTDPNLVLFCHEGGGTCVQQRMWIADLRHQQARKAAPLYPQRPGESCVHEYFTQQGDVGFQYTLDRDGGREEFNAFIRPDGMWVRQYRFPGPRPGHMQSNSDNTLLVGDGAYLSASDKDGNQFIGLMTHANGHVQIRRLAWHGSSWRTQASHGHPSFSPDDRWVIFNSDAGKCDNVYMADVQSI